MAKMRGIKPEIWTDSAFVSLSPAARLLWIGSWNFACDNGHLKDSPIELKMKVLPADPVDVAALVEEIVGQGLYVRENGYLTVPNFRKHQKIDVRYMVTCSYCSEQPAEVVNKIYYARCGDYIKIGQTTQPVERRLVSLRSPGGATVYPPDVDRKATELIGWHVATEELTEARLHWRFRASRTEWGEWFEVTPELLDHVALTSAHEHSRQAGDLPRGENSRALTSAHDEGEGEGEVKVKGVRGTRRRSATAAPAKLELSEAEKKWAAETCPDVDVAEATEEFLTWAKSVDKRYADWLAAWRNAMKRRQSWHNERAASQPVKDTRPDWMLA